MLRRPTSRPAILTTLTVAALVAVMPPGPAVGEHRDATVALRAEDAVEAAIAWSGHAYPEGATAAALATTGDFADALAGGLVQGTLDAPLLLTPGETLDPRVRAELERLGVTEVRVLGGPAALSEDVVAELADMGLTTTRLSGQTRIETAIAIAEDQAPDAQAVLLARAFAGDGGDPTRAWADSLAAGPLAAGTGRPLLLTATDALPASVVSYLESSSVTTVEVIGGAAAVSDRVVAELEALGMATARLSGPNRAATAVAIAQRRGFADASAAGTVLVLDGQEADAWAAGLAAAGPAVLAQAPMVLASGEVLPPESEAFLSASPDAPPALVCAPLLARRACDLAAGAAGYDALHANATASAAPELVRAELRSVADGVVHVRYWFDEEVRLGSRGAGAFRLAPPDTTAAVAAERAAVAEDAPEAVDAAFTAGHAALHATLALADAGAVQDAQEVDSPDGGAELGDVRGTPGRTRRPDLVAAVAEAGALVLTFDAPVDTAVGRNIVAVTADSRAVTGGNATVSDGGRTVRVSVEGLDPEQVRRAALRPGAVFTSAGSNPLSAVAVAGGGLTDGPDLVEVVPRPASDEVRFTFDADLAPFSDGGDRAGFRLRYVDGTEVTAGEATELVDARTVAARFPEGAVNRLVVGAAVAEGAVQTLDAVPAMDDAAGLAQAFAFGESLGPRLIAAELRELEAEGATAAITGDAEVRFVFDGAVTQANSLRFAAVDRDGARVNLSSCSVEPGIAQDTVVCSVPPPPIGEESRMLVAGTVAYDAVRAATAYRTGTEPASGFGRSVSMPGVPWTVPFA
ncbi:MAG TPA: cell wall-binding repeat-containing protein [Egibacteraceae bacterium]|nr:cell wall-binding repeat-containing protein [Egibacteraceae bacterium]